MHSLSLITPGLEDAGELYNASMERSVAEGANVDDIMKLDTALAAACRTQVRNVLPTTSEGPLSHVA